MIQRTMVFFRFHVHVHVAFWNTIKHTKNVSGSEHEKIRTLIFGSGSATELDVPIKKRSERFILVRGLWQSSPEA